MSIPDPTEPRFVVFLDQERDAWSVRVVQYVASGHRHEVLSARAPGRTVAGYLRLLFQDRIEMMDAARDEPRHVVNVNGNTAPVRREGGS